MGEDTFKKIVQIALEEDGVDEDITSFSLIPKNISVSANIIAKQALVLSGIDCIKTIFENVKNRVKIKNFFKEADLVKSGSTVANISGDARTIVSCERTVLNILGRLCGIATMTKKYVDAVKSSRKTSSVLIVDTRKTHPGLRFEEKMAVKAGGGVNHRLGLYDMVLIKDNHLAFLKLYKDLKNDKQAIKIALNYTKNTGLPVQVEVKNKEELEVAIKEGAGLILLDNMRPYLVKSMVDWTECICSKLKIKKPIIEYSGGVNLKNVRKYASCGIDRISIGALTHSSASADLSMEIIGVG
ncbi:nicotinate-nucleotide diphosphorylase (carboxylating) [bacterium Unc6]|nr:nicotinate-nucleotide diphosphorylase (carboxylating) [bacterium Unc6]